MKITGQFAFVFFLTAVCGIINEVPWMFWTGAYLAVILITCGVMAGNNIGRSAETKLEEDRQQAEQIKK